MNHPVEHPSRAATFFRPWDRLADWLMWLAVRESFRYRPSAPNREKFEFGRAKYSRREIRGATLKFGAVRGD